MNYPAVIIVVGVVVVTIMNITKTRSHPYLKVGNHKNSAHISLKWNGTHVLIRKCWRRGLDAGTVPLFATSPVSNEEETYLRRPLFANNGEWYDQIHDNEGKLDKRTNFEVVWRKTFYGRETRIFNRESAFLFWKESRWYVVPDVLGHSTLLRLFEDTQDFPG